MELGVNPLTPHNYRGGVGGSFFCLDCGQRPEALIHTFRPADHSKPIPPPPSLTKRRLVEEGIALILQGLGVKDNSIPQELVANLLLGLIEIARGDH